MKYVTYFALMVLSLLSCQNISNKAQKNKKDNKSQENNNKRPNIIFFFADDLGYGDLNCYGGIPETKNIDKMAENGLKFTHFYAPAPNSSPSRAGLLTGRNPNRAGIYTYRKGGHSMHLKDKEITIAERLKDIGYQTALFGKWHLGNLQPNKPPHQPLPSDQGFDYWLANYDSKYAPDKKPIHHLRHGEQIDTVKGYNCQILAYEAKQWLDNRKHKEQPFFLYIPFHEVHKKIAAPDSLIQKYKDENDSVYQATVENMDHAVGQLITYLKATNQFENTLIIYSSDNGSYRHGSNGHLRGYKGECYEGGVRVPGIIHWPAKIKEHKVISEPAGLVDMFPTICDVTDIDPPKDRKLDGISLMPFLNGQSLERSKPLLWFFYRGSPEAGFRDGKYLLNAYTNDSVPRSHYLSSQDMEFIKQLKFKQFKLYNLEKDPLQKHDISDKKPHIRDSLVQKFRSTFNDIQNDGYDWENLPASDPEHVHPKREYMRNKKVRWDW